MRSLIQYSRFIGPLRTILFLSVIVLSITAIFSMGETHKSGLMMFPTLIAPATVPMLFFVIPLDMMMCRIMMSGKNETQRKRYWHLIGADFAVLALLFVSWFPFYMRLLTV